MAGKSVAKTWEDGSYKFPYLKFELYVAVNYADDLIMGGTSLDDACKAAERNGATFEEIKAVITEAYSRHTNSLSGLREAIEKNTQVVDEVKKTTRKTIKFKKLIGREEEILYYKKLGASIEMLSRTFEVSSTQMGRFLKELAQENSGTERE